MSADWRHIEIESKHVASRNIGFVCCQGTSWTAPHFPSQPPASSHWRDIHRTGDQWDHRHFHPWLTPIHGASLICLWCHELSWYVLKIQICSHKTIMIFSMSWWPSIGVPCPEFLDKPISGRLHNIKEIYIYIYIYQYPISIQLISHYSPAIMPI